MTQLTHKSSWVCVVSSDFSVDLHQPLVQDLLALIVGQSILQPVSQENHEGQTFPQLVGSTAWSGALKMQHMNFVTSLQNTIDNMYAINIRTMKT